MSSADSTTTVGRDHNGPGRPGRVRMMCRCRMPGPDHRWAALVLPVRRGRRCWRPPSRSTSRRPPRGPGVELAPGSGWPYALNGAGLRRLLGGRAAARPAPGVRLGAGLARRSSGRSTAFAVLRPLRHPAPTTPWPGMTLALWFLNRFGAFLPLTVAVLLLIFPTGRFLAGPWGVGQAARGAPWPAGAVRDAWRPPTAASTGPAARAWTSTPARSRCPRGRRRGGARRGRGRRSPACSSSDGRRWSSGTAAPAGSSGTGCAGCSGRSMAMAVVDRALAALRVLADRRHRDVPRHGAAGRRDDRRHRPAHARLGRATCSTAPCVFALLSVVLIAVDLAVRGAAHVLLGDSLAQRQVVLVVLLLTAVLYGPLRQRLSALRAAAGPRRARTTPTTSWPGSPPPSRPPTRDRSSSRRSPRAVASAFGVGFVSVEVDRAGG